MAEQPMVGPSNHRRRHTSSTMFCLKNRTKPSLLVSHVYHLFLLLILATLTVSTSQKNTCLDCDQGKCTNGICVCNPGFRGSNCNECYGRVSLQPGKSGIIFDGAGDYKRDLVCSWLLDAGQDNMRVQFEFNSFSTECSWDHLYIHNGDSSFAPLVGAFSGIMGNTIQKPHLKFQLNGRYVFIHLYSDAAFTLPGFNISYLFDDCDLQCSENGVCNNSVCQCQPGWSGTYCTNLDEGCLYNCSQHGVCHQGKCQCDAGYRGKYCDMSDTNFYIEAVEAQGSIPNGRASAPLVYDESGALWLFGGYQMGMEQPGNNILQYVLASNSWLKVQEQQSTSKPWPRFGHTVVFYEGKFFLFGGISKGKVKADLWSFDQTTGIWTKLASSPRDLVGHTAHVFDKKMLIILGYSSIYSYSNKVLEYNFETGEWTIIKASGAEVLGGYGHVSVLDVERAKIYVSGGYFSITSTTYNLTDRLYQYDPVKKDWYNLKKSGGARYLHSAAMVNGLMITFGGSMHNNSQMSKQAKCSVPDFMVYDRECNTWHSLPSSVDKAVDFSTSLARFGHSMVTVENEIYIFGGFNSVVKNDMYKILPGNCSYFVEEKECGQLLPGVKCMWDAGHCEVTQPGQKQCDHQDSNAECSGYNKCASCLSSSQCKWCNKACTSSLANSENCSKDATKCPNENSCGNIQNCNSCQEEKGCFWDESRCNERQPKICSEHKTCSECKGQLKCGWCSNPNTTNDGSCFDVQESDPASPSTSCPKDQWFYNQCPGSKSKQSTEPEVCKIPCFEYTACGNCTAAKCMWCSNPSQCIDTNSYVASFHYGQCMDWTTNRSLCKESDCSQHKSCTECQVNPKCGWCNDEANTGIGHCYDGSMTGPLSHTSNGYTVNRSICPVERWFFNDCPKCQCNGHSTCLNDTSTCKSCEHPTTGSQCQFCANGYYGVPKHGANCKVCSCNDQADTCDHVTGTCFCRTRGVVGMNCSSCDGKNKYTGNPKNGGTCYYRLSTDFQYTFNLSKPDDQNFTAINFVNTPTSSDRDLDFTLNCSTPAFINITYKSKSFPKESEYISRKPCDYFRTKFEHKIHAFGGNENTTFMVYVYDFKTPFTLQISFVQQEKINLYKFFIIFFSCFLALILLVAAAWKIKHKVESYRRGRRLEVEMQQMARRPFSTISVEIEKKSSPVVADRKDHLDSVLRRRKKQMGSKPSSIAIEPLNDNKAAILTLLVQLPTGNSDYAPSGNSGLAVGSALVSIGSNRKQSLEHIKGDRPKIRKTLNYNHPDVCA